MKGSLEKKSEMVTKYRLFPLAIKNPHDIAFFP